MKLNDIKTIDGLATYAQKAWGVITVDITDLDSRVMNAAFGEIEKVMQAFPVLLGKITKITKSKIGAMSTTFFGALAR